MPSIGYFLDIIEAISRRDWSEIERIALALAEDERKKKHFQVAHKIQKAIDIAVSNAGLEDILGTASAPLKPLTGKIPPLLHELITDKPINPVLSSAVSKTVNEFVGEWKQKDKLLEKGVSPRKGVLLYGPPGCGKTLLATHIAAQLKLRIFMVRFDSLISSYLGETGSNIKQVFDFVSNNRCILFIDELDAIAKLRDDSNELGELKRVVITLLQNLDIFTGDFIVIAGTNHPHVLDPAIWRRFDITLGIMPPKDLDRLNIMSLYLQHEIPKEIRDAIIHSTNGFTGADIALICNNAKRQSLLKEKYDIDTYLCLSILDHLNTKNYSGDDKSIDERKITAALALKTICKSAFSYAELEKLTGVPDSTLHNKFKKFTGVLENAR